MTTPTPADVAQTAEDLTRANQPDPFAPEGTDEHTLTSTDAPLSEDDRRKATEAVIKAGY